MITDLAHRLAIIWADLEQVVRSLGQGGGRLNPSVYDTAQCFRFNQPENPWPVIDWLMDEQQPDGGWAQSQYPQMRILSTLSAVMALKSLTHVRKTTQIAIDNGLAFLYRNQWIDWSGRNNPQPAGMELIFSRMLHEARAMGLPIDLSAYTMLLANGERHRTQLQRNPRLPDRATRHVWEGWGVEPLPALIDKFGTVGASPAASAFWLNRARSLPELAALCERVEMGLSQAQAATNSPLDHVVCTRWPLTDDERIFGLYVLVLGGMLGINNNYSLPASFRIALDQQLALVRDTMLSSRTDVLGKTPLDHDAKAIAITLLLAGGYQLPQQMSRYVDRMMLATTHWFDSSPQRLSSIAYTLHALGTLGSNSSCKEYQQYLYQHQEPTGLWASQLPQTSVQSTTTQIMIALIESGDQTTIPRLCHTLAMFQHGNGSWGGGTDCTEETAYAVLALLAAKRHNCMPEQLEQVLAKARNWMCEQYHPFDSKGVPLWHGKELYRPIRIARIAELTALIGLLTTPEGA